MIAGGAMGQKLADIFSINRSGTSAIFAFLFLFISFFVIKFKGNQLSEKEKYKPKITRIIRSA